MEPLAKEQKYFTILTIFQDTSILTRAKVIEHLQKKRIAIDGIVSYLRDMISVGYLNMVQEADPFKRQEETYEYTLLGKKFYERKLAEASTNRNWVPQMSEDDFRIIDFSIEHFSSYHKFQLFDLLDRVAEELNITGTNYQNVISYLVHTGFLKIDTDDNRYHWLTDRGRELKHASTLHSFFDIEQRKAVELQERAELELRLLESSIKSNEVAENTNKSVEATNLLQRRQGWFTVAIIGCTLLVQAWQGYMQFAQQKHDNRRNIIRVIIPGVDTMFITPQTASHQQ